MGAFVDTSRIAVTEGDNTIWIKRRMDFGTKCRVEDTLTQMALQNGEAGSIRFTIGAQKLALAIHNIIGWDGPDFKREPKDTKVIDCTPENIERLDPEYPLLIKVQEKIAELNRVREDAPDPNGSTTTGSPS